MDIKKIFGMTAMTFSISLQIGPIPGMIDGFKKGDIKSMTISYFMTGIIQTLFWLGYSICIKDLYVGLPSLTMLILFGIYLNALIYIKNRYHLFFILDSLIIILTFVIIKFLPEHVCDTSATIISIIWQTTNAETIRFALKYYSQEYINPLLSWISFMCFTTYWIYSLMIGAYIMFIPNFYGSIINTINLYLYYWAGGHFSKENCFISFLNIILKPENAEYIGSKDSIEIDFSKIKENLKNSN
jgi:hypothetical protein